MTPLQALASLHAALSSDEQAVDPGFLTTRKWAEAWGKSETQTGRILARGVAIGKVERKSFRIFSAQAVRPVPHYRVL